VLVPARGDFKIGVATMSAAPPSNRGSEETRDTVHPVVNEFTPNVQYDIARANLHLIDIEAASF
jgi:hypothetical protein